MDPDSTPVVVVMGVQGCGKSTLGSLLAGALRVPFVDGDDLHPQRNRTLMAAGTPLSDDDRLPWLAAVGQRLADGGEGVVVACSALKRAYRDLLRDMAPDVVFVHPYGSKDLVAARISLREHEYMPPSLLDSQYATLEHLDAAEAGITLDLASPPLELVSSAAAFITGSRVRAHQQG